MNTDYREKIKNKKRIVVKVGTSSLIHKETGGLDLIKVEHLVRELSDLHNRGKDVILVTSGAIGVGRKAAGLQEKPESIPMKQACAAIGQARLMMIYQKFFAEYNQVAAQILMTRNTMINLKNRRHAQDTFAELLELGAIPVVNANDGISTFEILHGDNDTLSAIVASLVDADLLILLSDIDGLYEADPRTHPEAALIHRVEELTPKILEMAGGAGSWRGTGGMATKLSAASIAMSAGCDMVITNGQRMEDLYGIVEGRDIGTRFLAAR